MGRTGDSYADYTPRRIIERVTGYIPLGEKECRRGDSNPHALIGH